MSFGNKYRSKYQIADKEDIDSTDPHFTKMYNDIFFYKNLVHLQNNITNYIKEPLN